MARCPLYLPLPAFWHISFRLTHLRRQTACVALLVTCLLILCIYVYETSSYGPSSRGDRDYENYVQKYVHVEATNTEDPNLYYGVVVDAGSSGTRVFVYFWPSHTGKNNELLQIHQMRDPNRQPVVKKIKPGLAELASTPSEASIYMKPLLNFAVNHIPESKIPETPLYILATAGMRMLPESQSQAILDDLKKDIPLEYGFLFPEKNVEVISGKQEGVYAWIGINYVLGRFDHSNNDEPVVEVELPGAETSPQTVSRKRTVGVLDMGGGSAQIAYEVPQSVSFNLASPQEVAAKELMAEFNLGCDQHESDHVYRVYVTTFLGYGGNAARSRYEGLLINSTLSNKDESKSTIGLSPSSPFLDPCLPSSMTDQIVRGGKTYHFKGTGDYVACKEVMVPVLGSNKQCQKEPCSLGGVYQANINFDNSEFYGFSEYWYCMEDVLRMGGVYEYNQFENAAKKFCATRWTLLQEHHEKGLYSKADEHRLKYQCFKSAWITTVLHKGFKFPKDYHYLRSASLIHDKEVQWTLGAILYRTRFLPLREIQQGAFQKSYKPPWIRVAAPWLSNQYVLVVCFLVVIAFIFMYSRWLGRMRSTSTPGLTRVPTMAYFMTEEGQVQDGVYDGVYEMDGINMG
ncbi:ectonucleoside triphosphate diphosphohydrolase 4 isoform X1 [Strongylocentrotus purpuratus]|uniref:Ectonucleoside triphosphate diphosphohydrolase 4 n=1 Tax=Strongylocentrotus purpuratus TaxID=7668 RepID=A0A7M7HJR0_STRPU|nr:ectonucleoside triphosphate diphosphohydrolase 4 isoform X1 [Strongylocentrotus purpuratus]